MELRDIIEAGAEKAGSVAELARIIGTTREATTAAKSHRRTLPIDSLVKLADYTQTDLRQAIAANELATEKKEEKREFWRPFVTHARMALIVLALGHVTNFVTANDAEAAPLRHFKQQNNLYYVKYHHG